jgi:hypothetical protein
MRKISPDLEWLFLQVVAAVTLFILAKIGKHFIDVPPFDLASSFKVNEQIIIPRRYDNVIFWTIGTDWRSCWQDSAPLTPIVFVLSTGADPTLYLYNLAREMSFLERLRMISLGQVSHTCMKLMKMKWNKLRLN